MIRFIQKNNMIIPDDQLLLLPPGLLPPQGDDALLVGDKHNNALVHLAPRTLFHRLAELVHVFFTVARGIRALNRKHLSKHP